MGASFPELWMKCSYDRMEGRCLGFTHSDRRIVSRYGDIIPLLLYDGNEDKLVSTAFEKVTGTTGEISICVSTTDNRNKSCEIWIEDTFASVGLIMQATIQSSGLLSVLEE